MQITNKTNNETKNEITNKTNNKTSNKTNNETNNENQLKTCLLLHVPHSSIAIPEEERREILIDDAALKRELLRFTDHYTDELYDIPDALMQKNHYSRLLFDPERFRNDSDEFMSRYGMGVIYNRTEKGEVLRDITDERREELVRKYYDPYHLELERKTAQILEKYGRCLIIDGHSFPDAALHYEVDKTTVRPDICIGTESYHTPGFLSEFMVDFVKTSNYSVRKDFPFYTSMVPAKYLHKDKRVSSVLIEINRRLYMDGKTGEKLPRFDSVREFIYRLVSATLDEFNRHCSAELNR